MKLIQFCHRPKLGISVCLKQFYKTVEIAACFTHSKDKFSRKKARQILLQRLNSYFGESNNKTKYVAIFNSDRDFRALTENFRLIFKPDIYELDTTFYESSTYMDVTVRHKMTADQIWNKIQEIIKEIS